MTAGGDTTAGVGAVKEVGVLSLEPLVKGARTEGPAEGVIPPRPPLIAPLAPPLPPLAPSIMIETIWISIQITLTR